MEEKGIEEKDELSCAVCEKELEEENVVRNKRFVYCKECWNEKVLKDRKILPPYALFVAFVLFQIFF